MTTLREDRTSVLRRIGFGDHLREYGWEKFRNLSDMAGQKTEFFILVEAKGSPDGDCVRVWEPKITQKGTFGTE